MQAGSRCPENRASAALPDRLQPRPRVLLSFPSSALASGSVPSLGPMERIRCSGDEGRCQGAITRADAEAVVPESPPWIGRYFDLARDEGRWSVFVSTRNEVETVRCPEHRGSIL